MATLWCIFTAHHQENTSLSLFHLGEIWPLYQRSLTPNSHSSVTLTINNTWILYIAWQVLKMCWCTMPEELSDAVRRQVLYHQHSKQGRPWVHESAARSLWIQSLYKFSLILIFKWFVRYLPSSKVSLIRVNTCFVFLSLFFFFVIFNFCKMLIISLS